MSNPLIGFADPGFFHQGCDEHADKIAVEKMGVYQALE
jgi:hypothetical protein